MLVGVKRTFRSPQRGILPADSYSLNFGTMKLEILMPRHGYQIESTKRKWLKVLSEVYSFILAVWVCPALKDMVHCACDCKLEPCKILGLIEPK